MQLTAIKPLLAAIGTSIMLSVLVAHSIHADESQRLHVDGFQGHSLSISRSHGEDRVYVLDGKTIQWQDLTPAQQKRLIEIEEKMDAVELKLSVHEEELDPLVDAIEREAEVIEAQAEAIEAKAEELAETIGRDQRAKMKALEKELQVHESKMRDHEVVIRQKEGKIREFEAKIHAEAKVVEQKMKQHIGEIITVLKEST